MLHYGRDSHVTKTSEIKLLRVFIIIVVMIKHIFWSILSILSSEIGFERGADTQIPS